MQTFMPLIVSRFRSLNMFFILATLFSENDYLLILNKCTEKKLMVFLSLMLITTKDKNNLNEIFKKDT